MKVLAGIFFTIALFGGTAFVAGVLWMLFAHSLWGRPTGPPPGLSPEEARQWALERARAKRQDALNWADVRAAVAEGRWREVWPALFVVGGMVAVLLFLPLGILTGTRAFWTGLVGLAAGIVIVWRIYAALWQEKS